MLAVVVKAIILITILCNDGKQDQKKKKKVKNMESELKKKVSQLWKWQKVFSSHAGHL